MKLPQNEVRDYIRNHTKEDQIKFWLLNQCAPVLACGKPSFISCLESKDALCFRNMASGMGLRIKKLYESGNREVLFVYQPERMIALISEKENIELLQENEYEEFNLNSVFRRLGIRMQKYHSRDEGYPHEIGVLLGYPIWDVRGYIKHHGQNYIYKGYWKVYQEADKARRVFESYDKARYQMLQELIIDSVH